MNESLEQREAEVAPEQIAANLRAWIHDLRTTDAKQAEARLRTKDDEYCCLGRACVVLGVPMVLGLKEDWGYSIPHAEFGGESNSQLDRMTRSRLGITKEEMDLCWKMNDGRDEFRGNSQSFAEIADWLEANVLPRYSPEPAAS